MTRSGLPGCSTSPALATRRSTRPWKGAKIAVVRSSLKAIRPTAVFSSRNARSCTGSILMRCASSSSTVTTFASIAGVGATGWGLSVARVVSAGFSEPLYVLATNPVMPPTANASAMATASRARDADFEGEGLSSGDAGKPTSGAGGCVLSGVSTSVFCGESISQSSESHAASPAAPPACSVTGSHTRDRTLLPRPTILQPWTCGVVNAVTFHLVAHLPGPLLTQLKHFSCLCLQGRHAMVGIDAGDSGDHAGRYRDTVVSGQGHGDHPCHQEPCQYGDLYSMSYH